MKKPIAKPLILATIITGALTSLGLQAEEINTPTYYALTECVSSQFYDGGYEVGDKKREALMTEVLALKGQPPYSEELYTKVRESDVSTSEFMPIYTDCIGGDLYEKVIALAPKHGIESEEY